MFILPLASWGVLFITDPLEQAVLQRRQAEQQYDVNVATFYREFVDSAEGQTAAREEAMKRAQEDILKKARSGRVQSFGIPATAETTQGLFQAVAPGVTDMPADGPKN
jgi:hypothetical protein